MISHSRDPCSHVAMTHALFCHSLVEGKCIVEADIVLLSHITGGQGLQRLHQLNDGRVVLQERTAHTYMMASVGPIGL